MFYACLCWGFGIVVLLSAIFVHLFRRSFLSVVNSSYKRGLFN